MESNLELSANTEVSTPDRILLAAEELFSQRGVDGVSLREITSAAGVNSASAHYHFGSKHDVLKALFTRRAEPIAARRVQLLGQLKRDQQGRPQLEDVLKAFLWPALEGLDTAAGTSFSLLRARMAFETEEVRRDVLARVFDASSQLALKELAAALPELTEAELHWRFHFTLGAMVYTMAKPGRIESITSGQTDTQAPEQALDQLVRFAAAGFRSF